MRGCLQTKRLLLAIYLLLWPPLIILFTRQSYQPQIFGWWTYRVALLLVAALLIMIVATLLLLRLYRSDRAVTRLEQLAVVLRHRRWAGIAAGLLPLLMWLAAVVYLALLGVRLDWRLLVSLADLALLVALWQAALLLVGRSWRKQRELVMKGMLAGFALLLSLACVELVGNVLHLSPYVTWQVNPKQLDVRFRTDDFDVRVITNNQGLREREEIPRRHPGVFRIVAIGDSFTFGWGVENDEAYPKVAQSVLRGKYDWQDVEIINMGRPGSAPHDHLRFTLQYARQLDPDVVLIGFLVGDDCPVISPARLSSEAEVQRERELHVQLAQVNGTQQLLAHSYLVRLVIGGLLPRLRAAPRLQTEGRRGPVFGEPNPLDPGSMEQALEAADDPADARRRYDRLRRLGWVDKGLKWEVNPWLIQAVILRPGGPADSLAVRPATQPFMPYEWQLCEALLEETLRATQEMGAEMAVVALPNAHLVSQRWVDFIAAEWECDVYDEMTRAKIINQWLSDFCDRHDLLCVDPVDAFRARRDAGEDLYLQTDDHMTAAGHQLVGEMLAPALYRRFHPQARPDESSASTRHRGTTRLPPSRNNGTTRLLPPSRNLDQNGSADASPARVVASAAGE